MTAAPVRLQNSLISRADLLWAMVDRDPNTVQVIASQLGLSQRLPRPDLEMPSKLVQIISESLTRVEAPPEDSSGDPNQRPDIALWLMTHYFSRVETDATSRRNDPEEPKPSYWNWKCPPLEIPQNAPLTPWPVLWHRLRKTLAPAERARQVDIPRLVDRFARREVIRQLPRVKDASWNGRFTVVRDCSSHLVPYLADQTWVIEHLRPLLPPQSLTVLSGREPYQLYRLTENAEQAEYIQEQPGRGGCILILGDLGCLTASKLDWQKWLYWGRTQKIAGCRLFVLFPGSLRRLHPRLREVYAAESWQTDRSAFVSDQEERQKLIRSLLTLAAPALRLEPGLLRDLRQLLPYASDVSLEADLWQSPLLSSRHLCAATIDRQLVRDELRPAFELLPESLRRKVLTCIRRWRRLLEDSPEVWFEEILNLEQASRDLVPASDIEDARANWRAFDQLLSSPEVSDDGVAEFADRFTRRATDEAIEDAEIGQIVRKYRGRYHRDLGIHPSTDPIEIDPDDEVRSIKIHIDDVGVTLSAPAQEGTREHLQLIPRPELARTRSSNGCIQIRQSLNEPGDAFWKTGKPDFVSDYGTDKYGAWFEFQVPWRAGTGVVTQRMRWIRAGTFLMGSPQGERDRDSDETQHEVKLSRGYWLADTACTQELWEAVTGKTPSHFKGDRRPVERVSYDNVIKFVSALAKLVPDLSPALPTESQWEYACRAGTTTPFSFGDTINTDEVNFNGNYPYGNSPKGEYRQETVELKSLPSNCWGLYEMHGNVWEWCSDWFGEYSPEPQVDPAGPAQGSGRVMRGGSWGSSARYVRSACRYWFDPGYRYRNLGFRLLSSASAEPTEAAEVPVAEQGSEQTRFGEAAASPPLPWQGERAGVRGLVAKTIRVDEGTTSEVELSSLGPIRIRSNLEEVFLERMTKPKWAVAFGRDRFGTYYADFQVSSIEKGAPVRQRMRWIPPGRFQMGSPADEPGRYDSETQHDVTISSGFWMFDTPCTQALWLAVMAGKNPSHFTDLTRPVEQLNWDHACQFAAKLTSKMPELSFSLPTEAQWEYACRAGTTTAIYTGPLEILGDANAPALDEIAWYGGNCGVDFELSNGQAVTWLRNKQYDFEKGGTRRVKQKRPNPWGLYDMLGNVWEWCQDWKGDYPSESQVDPIGPEMGSCRVMRGGSWRDDARFVRSACRSWRDPGARFRDLGFRLLSSASPDRNQRPNK